MNGVLILAPDPTDERFWARTGDAFDTALVEVLRTLDAAEDGFYVLAPWTEDLAPLVLAATFDTGPSFDPEVEASGPETRSRIVPYSLPGAETPGLRSPYWRASAMSLTRRAALPLQMAVKEYRPDVLLVLGLPADTSELLGGMDLTRMKVLTFGVLLSSGEVAEVLDVSLEQVRDLQLRLPERAEPEVERMSESALERSAEVELEPYVPYGLLLQDALEEFLPGE